MTTATTAAEGGGLAPFVGKTYRMVEDPSTDGVIAWGRDSNSFVVVDPFTFSQILLPAHFKHSNFSSFVRQLNTYGFRKVDPDRWEFAHVSFLRGQTHLLRRIVRRSSSGGKRNKDDGVTGDGGEAGELDEESAMVAMEVARLRQEQREIEERVAAMWRRVQEAERRPKQMLAFLVKVVGDPHVLRRLLAAGTAADRDATAADADRARGEVKRPRHLLDATTDHVVTAGGGGGNGSFYGGGCAPELDAFVPDDTAVDFTGLYTGGDAFGDAAAGVVDGGYPPPAYAFQVDSGY